MIYQVERYSIERIYYSVSTSEDKSSEEDVRYIVKINITQRLPQASA